MKKRTAKAPRRGIFSWWRSGFSNSARAATGWQEQKMIVGATRTYLRRTKEHLRNLHQCRDPYTVDAPDMTNFDEVLAHWGIHNQELPLVIRAMKLEIGIYAVLGLAAIFGGIQAWRWQAPMGVACAAMVIFTAVVVVVCRSWRLQVLVNKRFEFFVDWLLCRRQGPSR